VDVHRRDQPGVMDFASQQTPCRVTRRFHSA
jgi:hypothetical protein